MYRLSRNSEASIVQYIEKQLIADGWNNIRVEKVFAEVYKGTLPCICINVSSRPDSRREVGSDTLSKYINIDFRIFATSDGLRLDLADWGIEKIITGIDYYEYVTDNDVIISKTLKGRINFLEITQNRKELRMTDNIVLEDRYRHLLSLRCRVALI